MWYVFIFGGPIAISELVNSQGCQVPAPVEYPELARDYGRAQRLWSGSYFAGSGGGAPPEGPSDRPEFGGLRRGPVEKCS